MQHVDDNTLTAYVAGALPHDEQSRIRDHLDDCAECRMVALAVGKRVDTFASGSEPPPPPRASQRRLLEAGAHVGPYIIERLVGAGGMGVVYAARDPRLDRLVALKLIRHGGRDRDEIAERMRRESKALARLSHANVTTVYELGTADDEIFVAMEYVAGATLRAWSLEAPRTRADILATFVKAGRGLAAAHAAGLVHRDFKPDNVLIGHSGVVKVTDFGLARIADEVSPPDALAVPSPSVELTSTGAVIGTPAYMAPEQFTHLDVDARADQFAFCVALYEALYGERPFRGATIEELRAAVLAGRIVPPRERSVPPRIRRALLRGLAVEPRDRFAAIDDLLAELAPRRPTLALALGGGAVAATAAIAAVVLSHRAAAPVCRGAAAEVDRVWNADRRAVVERAFATTGAPDASATAHAVTRGLDDYFARWATMFDEACAATRVHEQQSEAALDLRTACLERDRAEVDALVGVLARADAGVVTHAREAIQTLPDLSACIDVAALSRRAQEPVAPQLRARLDAARAKVSVARYREALPELAAIVADPTIEKYPTLEAEAQHLRAKAFEAEGSNADAEKALFRGLVRAQAARADEWIAQITVDLAHVVGFKLQRTADGMRWVELAQAAIAARGGDDLLAVRLATVRAGILERDDKLVEAEAADRDALAVVQRKAAGGPLEAEVQDALGMVLALQGKLPDAVQAFESALVLNERAYGTHHALTASVHANLANALSGLHRVDDALAHYRAALEIDETLFGKDSLPVAVVLSNLGQMLQEGGKLAEARTQLERALAIRERALGPDDPAVARTAANLGYVLLDEKNYQGALDMFARVGAILEKKLGADHPARSDDLAGTGLAWIGLGKPERAIEPFTRAVALAEQGGDPVNLASLRAGLARALYASGRDRAGGLKMARAARAVLAGAGETSGVAEIDGWLPR